MIYKTNKYNTLKGSTVDRFVKEKPDPNIALKDQNFKTKLNIGPVRYICFVAYLTLQVKG